MDFLFSVELPKSFRQNHVSLYDSTKVEKVRTSLALDPYPTPCPCVYRLELILLKRNPISKTQRSPSFLPVHANLFGGDM